MSFFYNRRNWTTFWGCYLYGIIEFYIVSVSSAIVLDAFDGEVEDSDEGDRGEGDPAPGGGGEGCEEECGDCFGCDATCGGGYPCSKGD